MATIQGVYVALFGRPADPAGLEYFNAQTNNGANLNAIGDLAATAEYQDRFDGQSNTQIVTAIYQSLFGRAPEAAGLEFFAAALENGTLNINNIAIAILDGAQGNDKTMVENKIAAANAFTTALNTATERQAYQGDAAAQAGRNFLTPVTADKATIPSAAATDAAIAAIVTQTPGVDPTPGAGVTIVLSTGDDIVSPTAANPAFKTTAANDTIVGGGNWTADDKIDGGLGTDTLTATLGGNLTVATGGLTNVENLVLKSTVASNLNVDKASGIKSVTIDASAEDVTVSNLVLGTALEVKGTMTADKEAVFTFKGADGSADAATLTLTGAKTSGVGYVEVNAIETLAVNVKGESTIELNAAQAKAITVTGTGNTNLGTLEADLKSLDASGLNGTLTVTLDANSSVTVTGTKLNDTVNLGAGGKDVVVYNAANISTKSLADDINGFQTGADADKIDVKAFALTGAKAITDFGLVVPVEGATFAGNAIAIQGDFIYFDTNNDGQLNFATDLAIDLGAAVVGTFSATDNVVWA